MDSFQANLPASLRAFVESRAAEGGFKSVDDYLCSLVIEEKISLSVPTVEDELLEHAKAEPAPVADATIDGIRQEIEDRRLRERRAAVQVGIDQADRGETAPLDIEAIIAEGMRRLEAERPKQKAAG